MVARAWREHSLLVVGVWRQRCPVAAAATSQASAPPRPLHRTRALHHRRRIAKGPVRSQDVRDLVYYYRPASFTHESFDCCEAIE